MPKFDEIKRNASGVADKAVKKTNEFTNIVKLKMGIKTSEAKLNSVYEEIGRLFYTAERNGEDCTSDIAAYIMKADKLKADIAASKKQITRLRNERVCDNCGSEIADDVAFCPFCGQKQEKLVEIEPEAETGEKSFEDIVEETVSTVEDAVEDIADRADDIIGDVADKVSDAAETVADKVEDIVEDVNDSVDGD